MRARLYPAAAVLAGILGGLAILELGVRAFGIRARSHVVRVPGVRLLHGAPVWSQSADREHRDCVERHPERTRVLFLGSSITYGFQLTAEETFTSALERRLNALRPVPGFCVLNFAQPGFAFDQKMAVAQDEIPRYRPALVLWEDWLSEPTRYVLIDGAAYGVESLDLRPDGFIRVPGMPDVLNRALFRHSRLYQYLVLTAANPHRDYPFRPFVRDRLARMPEEATSTGARLAMYLSAGLNEPFSDDMHPWEEPVFAMAQERGIPAYFLARELAGRDYAALALDATHFNAAGHRLLVPIFERIVLEQLLRPRPGSRTRRSAGLRTSDEPVRAP